MARATGHLYQLTHSFTQRFTFTNRLVLAFLLLGFIGILNHEIWRDEAQAWLIAIDTSLPELLNVLRHEGHPALWYLCLRFLGAFTHHPLAMQLFHLTIAAGVVYVFVQFSPFTRLQKLLFTFSYYPFFEYGLLSRNYSLGVLIVFLFCRFFRDRNRGYIGLSILLALLANTSIYGLIFALCLAAALCLDKFLSKEHSDLASPPHWNIAISLAIVGLGIIVAIAQILPASDYLNSYFQERDIQVYETQMNHEQLPSTFNSLSLAEVLKTEVVKVTRTIVTIWKSYVPISELSIDNYDFWNENLLTGEHLGLKALAVFLSLLLFAVCSLFFIQKPVVLFIYVSGTIGILVFIYAIFYGALRHHGHLFILLLVCLWLSRYYPQSCTDRKFSRIIRGLQTKENLFLVTILAVQVVAGAFAFSMDLMYPFSASKAAAAYIKSQSFNQLLMIGSEDKKLTPIAALLDQKIYYLESDRFGSYVHLGQRGTVSPEDVLPETRRIVGSDQMVGFDQTDALLIVDHPIDQDLSAQPQDLKVTSLSSFDRSLVVGETYYLYLVQAENAGGENAEKGEPRSLSQVNHPNAD